MAERPTYTAEEVDRAVEALGDPERFSHAQEIVTHGAPGLQRVLTEALEAGGWFDTAHQGAVDRAASDPDPQQRLMAVRALIADETRVGMLVGVAVGLELAQQLQAQRDSEAP